MSDTPRTDGEWNRTAYYEHPQFEHNLLDFARELERELAEVTEQRDRLAEAMRVMWPFIEEDDWGTCNTPAFSAAIKKYQEALDGVFSHNAEGHGRRTVAGNQDDG